jgi:hypothetical protein
LVLRRAMDFGMGRGMVQMPGRKATLFYLPAPRFYPNPAPRFFKSNKH